MKLMEFENYLTLRDYVEALTIYIRASDQYTLDTKSEHLFHTQTYCLGCKTGRPYFWARV